MTYENESEIEILSKLDAESYELAAHVDTKIKLSDTEKKHEVLIAIEQRCKESFCSCKILRIAAQSLQRNIELRHNWVDKALNHFVCTDLYEYALNIVNLYRTLSANTYCKKFFCRVEQR